MRNPFAKPHTPGQWLLGSVCWTVSSISLWWWMSTKSATALEAYSPAAIGLLSILIYWPACLLIWWKGVMHGNVWVWSMPTNKAWFKMTAGVWLAVLTAFQILTTILGIACTFLAYSDWSANTQVSFL
jgi:hypothetical protein